MAYTLTLSGRGKTADFGFAVVAGHEHWVTYSRQISKIVISDGITGIGENTFGDLEAPYHYNLSNVKDISIGDSVETLDAYALHALQLPGSLKLPKSLRSLTATSLPSAVSAYALDAANTHFVVHDGVLYGTRYTDSWSGEELTDNLIRYPANATAKTYQARPGTKAVMSSAFAHSRLEEVILSDGIEELGDYAFTECKQLRKVELPEGITSIGWETFSDCSSLSDIQLPSTVTAVTPSAFWGTGLEKVVLPAAVSTFSLFGMNGPEGGTELEGRHMDFYFQGNAPTDFELFDMWNKDGSVAVNLYYLTSATGWSELIAQTQADVQYYDISFLPYEPEAVAVTGVSVAKTASVQVGKTKTLTATVRPNNADNKSVYWTSDDTYVVSVDTNGKLTGVKEGTANVTATTVDGGFTATCAVTVTKASTSGGGAAGGGGGGGSSSGGSSGGGTTVKPSAQPTATPSAKPIDISKPASENFADVVKDSWYEDGVTYVVRKGLFNGVADRTFAPQQNMTRAMLVTVLARLDGQDTAGGETWYAKGTDWAKAQGVSDGTMLDQSVTREQMVTMLYRYAKAAVGTADLSKFTDSGKVSDWAKEAMAWAVEKGILTGKDGSCLDPQGTATRAEVATILQRFVEKT